MKVTRTKKATLREIVTEENIICETAFEEADFEEYDTECCVYSKDAKYRPTLLEQSYEAWKKRKEEEKLYGRDYSSEVNLTEELVYSCLPDDNKSCLHILRV